MLSNELSCNSTLTEAPKQSQTSINTHARTPVASITQSNTKTVIMNKSKKTLEILTAIAIAPFLAALVLGAREAEIEEESK